MDIKKIVNFCETFGVNSDDLAFYPGGKREILMCVPEDRIVSIVPQEENFDSEEAFEEAQESFHDTWWYFDGEFFDVY